MKKTACVLLLILLPCSLLLNLGEAPLRLEEPRRAAVALEMLFSGNYIVPTQLGDPYFAKPPLFNWALLGSYALFGSPSEFAVRFPTVLSLLLIGLCHFLIMRKFVDPLVALYSSFFFITSGALYFYFSLLGEIDIFYSLLVYLSIIALFYFHQTNNLLLFYLTSFLFGALGFLTKGFPSLVFLYLSLVVLLVSERQTRKFFSRYHGFGILVFLMLVGAYFFLYSRVHPLDTYLGYLWHESSKRTLIEHGMPALLRHLFVFPLDTFAGLLPWSVLIVFVLRKGALAEILSIPALRFSLLIFFFNFLVYWISPEARRRYIYMLLPFLITIITHFAVKYSQGPSFRRTVLLSTAGFAIGLSALCFLVLPSLLPSSFLSPWVALGFSAVFVLIFVFFRRNREEALLSVLLTVMVLRIAFDVFFLPARAIKGDAFEHKANASAIAKVIAYHRDATGTPERLCYLGSGEFPPGLAFYIMQEQKAMLCRASEPNRRDFFIARAGQVQGFEKEILHAFSIRGEPYLLLRLARL